jgi:hypothetical protein
MPPGQVARLWRHGLALRWRAHRVRSQCALACKSPLGWSFTMMNAKLLPFNLSLEQFRSLAMDVLRLLDVPFERPLEISNIEEHPDSDPETIETTMWSSGSARISIVKLADRHVAMESTDRSCYGTLEGLPGDVVLRVNGDGFGRLGSYALSGGDDDAVGVVEREWIRAIAEFARPRVPIDHDPLLPDSWQAHAARLPVAAVRCISVDFGYRRRWNYLWQIHEPSNSPFGVWTVGYPAREIPGARLKPIGPMPPNIAGGVLGAFAVRDIPLSASEIFNCVVQRSLLTPEVTIEEATELAERYRSGAWVFRVRTSAQGGVCWLQSEQHESPMLWLVWTLRKTNDGFSGDASFLLLGEDEAVSSARQRLGDWLRAIGWHLGEPRCWRPL